MKKEFEIQAEFFKKIRSVHFLYRYPKAEFIHAIPNGARVSIGQAVKLKKQGLLSGVPDVFVPFPLYVRDKRIPYHGLYIEFKTLHGKLSANQKRFAQHCEKYGYLHEVCCSAMEAYDVVLNYLMGRWE